MNRRYLIGSQALIDVGDDRNSAGDGCLEGNRAIGPASGVEQLRTMLGQQRLIGRDDIFSGGQKLEHDRAGRLDPADELGDRRDFRIAGDPLQIGRDHAGRQPHVARLCQIANDNLLQYQPPPGPCAARSPWSNSSRATPEPTVPSPTIPILTVSTTASPIPGKSNHPS